MACHICQLSRNIKLPYRQLQSRINLSYRPLPRLSMDLKVMPRLNKGQKYILCIIDEVKNYLITVPMHKSISEEIGDALIDNVISKYCVANYIIMDQNSAFASSLMNYLFKKLDIKIKKVAPYNHKLLQVEHGICYHSNITGHTTLLGNFSIVRKEDQNLTRLIKESMYIRINNPSLNRNIGKYYLPYIWDEILLNNTELKLK